MAKATTEQENAHQHEVELAKDLEEWKRFSILKFDEGNKRMEAIELNQEMHIGLLTKNTTLTESLDKRFGNIEQGVGEVLGIVTALSGTKKTLGWVGKGSLWIASFIGAIVAIKIAVTQAIKATWL